MHLEMHISNITYVFRGRRDRWSKRSDLSGLISQVYCRGSLLESSEEVTAEINSWLARYVRGAATGRSPRYPAAYNVWPSQVWHGPVGGSVDKSLTMHRAGLQILVTSASPYWPNPYLAPLSTIHRRPIPACPIRALASPDRSATVSDLRVQSLDRCVGTWAWQS